MTQATITSYTLLDFISEGDMKLFFSFIEEHMDEHAARLRENGMTKFYVTRIFNKGDKFTIANWLEYRDQEAFVAPLIQDRKNPTGSSCFGSPVWGTSSNEVDREIRKTESTASMSNSPIG